MAIIRINCGHEDAPCCGCNEVMLTGEDALEAIDEQQEWDDMMHRNRTERLFHDSAEDALEHIQRADEVDLHDIAFEDRMCGEAY